MIFEDSHLPELI